MKVSTVFALPPSCRCYLLWYHPVGAV